MEEEWHYIFRMLEEARCETDLRKLINAVKILATIIHQDKVDAERRFRTEADA